MNELYITIRPPMNGHEWRITIYDGKESMTGHKRVHHFTDPENMVNWIGHKARVFAEDNAPETPALDCELLAEELDSIAGKIWFPYDENKREVARLHDIAKELRS